MVGRQEGEVVTYRASLLAGWRFFSITSWRLPYHRKVYCRGDRYDSGDAGRSK